MEEVQRREILSQVALGNVPPDTVITNGHLFNVFTGEFIKGQSIWIKDGMIAYVGPDHDPAMGDTTAVIDAEGMVLLPGLIDGHTHVISRSSIEEFVKYVIPGGTTTVITETTELATIVGKDGIKYFVEGLKDQPVRFFYTVSPLCGLTSAEEIKAPGNEELLPLLKDPRCVGVGEIYWGNIFLEGTQGERVRELASLALEHGKRVEGHGAGAKGKKLQAYTSFGIASDHEPITEEEMIERLRLGYWVMIREGAVRKELDGIKGIFNRKTDFRRLILSTDGMDPEGFVEQGYLDGVLKKALRLGVAPELAYRMVTLHVAEYFRLDHLIGSLSPGRMADVVSVPSPEEFSPQWIMIGGKIVFRDGKRTVDPRKAVFPDSMFDTVRVPDDNIFPSLPQEGKARVMELVSRLVTRETIIDLEDPEQSTDLIMAFALDRLGSETSFMGLLKGFGLRRGAYGSTMCWDTTDMVVVGCDAQSMKTVIERLKTIRGGGVYAIGDEVVAEFPAPLCGIISMKPMRTMRDEIKKIEEALKANGVKWEKPLLTIDTLTTPAIPHLRITHRGYVRLKDREILPVNV